nr:G-type lectin S-receptor-like serine/threonine-protein kinase CES101 [Ipomoea batatas]
MEEVVFFLLILCSVASIASSSQSDTLKQGDALNSSSSLVSANNNFTLGFFTPKGTNRTYLAIQCIACDSSDRVWIGNRETPLPTNSSATLQIDASGRLILTHTGEGQRNPFLLSLNKTSLNVTATLLDSGNFVLRVVNADGSFGEELWSSFDNPTDTLLPGMKLGVNHKTGRNWSLTSWQDDDILAARAYSLEWEPSRRRLVIKYRGVVRWTSGELMNATHFQHQSMGCELWEQPPCRGGGKTFEERSGTFYRDTENGLRVADQDITPQNSSGSPSDCRENCWNKCDCVGYRSYREGSCGYWRGTDLKFEQDNTGNTVHLYVLNRPDKGKPRSKTWIWILIPIVVSTVLVVLLLLRSLRRRRRKQEEARKEQELKDLLTLEEYNDIRELSSGENGSLKVFSYAWVVATTNNFSSDCKLGQGGFGSVYKGLTPEGQEVAIKQLSERSTQGLLEFKNEVVLIAKLQHTNLVKLLGFCIHGDQKMLIYEFMPNKSLDFYLFGLGVMEHRCSAAASGSSNEQCVWQ